MKDLKPKCRKTQRNYFGRVYCVNDVPAVNTIVNKSIRVPRENIYAVHRINAGHHFIKELKTIKSDDFDISKLIRFCEELNSAFSLENFLSTAMLVRAITDHIPPTW